METAIEAVLSYRDVMIPMRDGVRLATDIYIPSADGSSPASDRFPVLVTRTPYGKGGMLVASASADPSGAVGLARLGYVVAVQDVRGIHGSEGVFTGVMNNDGIGKNRDGYDTIEWLARQPWSNGAVGAWGLSYLGHTTIAAALAAPDHLKAGVLAPACDRRLHGGALYRWRVSHRGWVLDGVGRLEFDVAHAGGRARRCGGRAPRVHASG